MNHPHEQQAAAMDRAGELPDSEQLQPSPSCCTCGNLFDADVVHRQGSSCYVRDKSIRDQVEADIANSRMVYFDDVAKLLSQHDAALAAERAEVARLRDILRDIRQRASDMEIYYLADAALNPTQGATNHD